MPLTKGEQCYFNVPGVAVRWDAASPAHMESQGWANAHEFQGANRVLVDAITGHPTGQPGLGEQRLVSPDLGGRLAADGAGTA
jgi:hypothetical protein